MDKPYVVGMDIGGTNSVFGIVDARGNILCVDSIKTQAYKEFGDYVSAVAEKLLPMIQEVGGVNKIKGMGIGAPNGNYYTGNIEHSANLPWKGIVPLAEEFKKTMEGIYSTSVCVGTLDESPMAYKDTNEILELIKPTCDVLFMVKPKINIKATESCEE